MAGMNLNAIHALQFLCPIVPNVSYVAVNSHKERTASGY